MVKGKEPDMNELDSGVLNDTLEDGRGRSPKDTFDELGPTALFLRTTTARKAAVLQICRTAKLAEEETARNAAKERNQKMTLMLREASLAGTLTLRTALPCSQASFCEWSKFVTRRSILGLSFDDLIGNDANNEGKVMCIKEMEDNNEEKQSGEKRKTKGDRVKYEYVRRVAMLTEQLVQSKRQALSYKDLQEAIPHFDDDYRHLFGPRVQSASLWRQVNAFQPSPAETHEQNDFLTDRALLTRERLRDSDRVASLVTIVWLAADHDGTNCITREKYLALNRKLQICVLGLHDPGFCTEMAMRDWELDKDPKTNLLPFETLKVSLFMLADMYVPQLSEDAYCDFLATLAQRMIRIDPVTKVSLTLREDDYVIPRKVFQLVESKFPRWTAFSMPKTPRECRKMYSQTSWQLEDMVELERDEAVDRQAKETKYEETLHGAP